MLAFFMGKESVHKKERVYEKEKISAQEKLVIVLEGIQNRVPLGELCSRRGISQYYPWRDKLLQDGSKVC